MTTKEFDKANKYRQATNVECCLTCMNARRWEFEGRYSEDPSDLTAMCLEEDAPKEEARAGGYDSERKYVSAFHICDKWKKDKDIK